MATTTTLITDGTAVYHTIFRLVITNDGFVTKEGVYKYNMGPGTVLRFQAQDVGSPAPSLRLTTTDA